MCSSQADQPDPSDPADQAETVAATLGQTPVPYAPGDYSKIINIKNLLFIKNYL